jgi:hypothetical protein
MMRVPPPLEVASLVGSKVDDYRWHSTKRQLGSIRGVRSNLTLIASDGNLGAFIDASGKLFLGHVQAFSGRVRAGQ